MTLDIVNRRNPGTLGQPEIIDEYGIAHAHAVKRVSPQRRHFDARFGGINSKGRIQHDRSPALASFMYRQQSAQLEAFYPLLFKNQAAIPNGELNDFYKDCTNYTCKQQI
jgi:hypothetical protein